jgi:beta-lactamase superfamily II metal-dependent hydrolase
MKTSYWIFILFILFNFAWAQNPLQIYCIDVNTGSSTLIVSPAHKTLLIDAGEVSANYGDTVFRFIRSLGLTHLDHTLATHYHSDHIGGFPVVICSLSGGANRNDSILECCYDRGDVDTFYSTSYNNYRNVTNAKRRVINLGDTIDLEGGVILVCIVKNGKVINGDSVVSQTPGSETENYRSIGLILKYGMFETWIGGDLTGIATTGNPDVETKVAGVVGDADLYVCNHHGSRNSSNNTFLDSLRPEIAVFSQGTHPSNNSHPHQEAINRLINHNCYLYQLNDNPTGGIFSIPDSGKILNTSARIIVTNTNYIVNGDTYPIQGIRRDAAVLEIISPRDTILEGAVITPRAKIKNLGNITESFTVRFKIGSVYNKTKTIFGLAPDDSLTISFDTTWTALSGSYQVSCSTQIPGDSNPTNDGQSANLTIIQTITGWQKISDILNPVKDGGALVTAQGKIYAFIGNKTGYFYMFNPLSNTWQPRTEVPFGYHWGKLKKKLVKKGAALTFGQDNLGRDIIYAIKGNSTYEFWKYLIAQDSWIQENDQEIAFKGGSALAYVPIAQNTKYIYALWGSNRDFKFRAYNITTQQWAEKRASEKGRDNRKFKDGSCMVALRDSIFILKGGAKYNEFYCYDVIKDTWIELESMPQNHPDINRKKKVKTGGAMTYDAHTNKIYAFKGGGTQEFWSYDIAQDYWSPQEIIPKDPLTDKKSVIKAGGSLTALNGKIYALKGNNRNEFWQYTPDLTAKNITTNSLASTLITQQSENVNTQLDLSNTQITIFNIAGQQVKIPDISDLQSINKLNWLLSPGVYFVSIVPQNHNSIKTIKKIIISR